MLIFGKLQNKFKGLSHTILNEFFLGLLEASEFLDEILDYLISDERTKSSGQSPIQIISCPIWMVNQVRDDRSWLRDNVLKFLVVQGLLQLLLFQVHVGLLLQDRNFLENWFRLKGLSFSHVLLLQVLQMVCIVEALTIADRVAFVGLKRLR